MRRGKGRKRIWAVAVLVAALGLLAAGYAFGAAPIVGQADNTFNAPSYTIDQGEVAQLQVTGSSHNVTANQGGPDAKALFRSSTISGGMTPVDGTQYLSAGDYAFFCSIHPTTMRATLHVSSSGAPVARPTAQLTLRTRTISKALKKGVLIGINASVKIDGAAILAKVGKTTIGQATFSLAAGQQALILKLSKAGKSLLRHKDKASVALSANIPFGSPVSSRGKLS